MLNGTFALTLDSPGAGYHNSEIGWYLFDSMQESQGRPDYDWKTWADMSASVPPEQLTLQSLKYIHEIKGLICRPYPRWYDAIPIAEWQVFGSGSTTWEAKASPGNDPGTWYHQMAANLTTENGLFMVYAAPPMPAFGVSIRRAMLPPPADWDHSTLGDGYSKIMWGGGAYSLIIPLSGPMALYAEDGSLLAEMPLNLGHARGSSGVEQSQIFTVWIMHLRGRILISIDDTRSWWVYSCGEKAENAIITAAGQIQVSNVGSEWEFRLIPIGYQSVGQFVSKTFDKGYTPTSALEGGGPGGASADWQCNLWPASGLASTLTIAELSVDDRYSQYQADLTPVNYPVGSTYFGHTPELYAVRLQNKPVCTTIIGVSPPTISAAHILGIEVEDAEDLDMSRAVLTLNNMDGTYETLPEYMPVVIQLGVQGNPLTTVFSGYAFQPRLSEQSSGVKMLDLDCMSAALPLVETCCTEAEPVFAGKTVGEAIEWACLRCGIAFSKATYDTGTLIPAGNYGERAWQPGAGRSWMDFLKQVCSLEQYYLRFSGWSLMYLPESSSASITWHFGDGATHVGMPGTAMNLINELECPRDPSEHRNEIIVLGQDVDGRIIAAKYADASNIATVGWRKTVLVSDPAYDTQECVNRVAYLLAQKLMPYPPRQPSFRVEGNQDIKPRDIVKYWGGVSGYNLNVCRITRVVHRWTPATGGEWMTEGNTKWCYTDS